MLAGEGSSKIQPLRRQPGSARSRNRATAADFNACNRFDPTTLQAPLSCPVLVIAGESDQMTPVKAGLGVAKRFANYTVVKLPGCGHSMLGEKPNEVLDAMWGLVGVVTTT